MPRKAKTLTEISSLARTHTDTCIKVLQTIASQPKAPPAARVQAASALLDRGWGKPHQSIEQKTDITQWVVSEKELSPDQWQQEYGEVLKGNGADKANGS